jgi:hypothetical protein
MKWRRVSEAEVLDALDSPDRIQVTTGQRKNAYKLVGDRLLKVTYTADRSKTVIITVIEKEHKRGAS